MDETSDPDDEIIEDIEKSSLDEEKSHALYYILNIFSWFLFIFFVQPPSGHGTYSHPSERKLTLGMILVFYLSWKARKVYPKGYFPLLLLTLSGLYLLLYSIYGYERLFDRLGIS